jgi:hypothetical protein
VLPKPSPWTHAADQENIMAEAPQGGPGAVTGHRGRPRPSRVQTAVALPVRIRTSGPPGPLMGSDTAPSVRLRSSRIMGLAPPHSGRAARPGRRARTSRVASPQAAYLVQPPGRPSGLGPLLGATTFPDLGGVLVPPSSCEPGDVSLLRRVHATPGRWDEVAEAGRHPSRPLCPWPTAHHVRRGEG